MFSSIYSPPGRLVPQLAPSMYAVLFGDDVDDDDNMNMKEEPYSYINSKESKRKIPE